MDVTKNYNGKSMLVLGFVHDEASPHFTEHYKKNWPSPILFDDNTANQDGVTANIGSDNLHVVNVSEFRVFNNNLYRHVYGDYRLALGSPVFGAIGMLTLWLCRHHFPEFHELHKTRKEAGQSTQEMETSTDSLAFQGTIRIKKEGRVISETLGSGHHGADAVGMASIRAGKGHKMNLTPPMLQRLI